MGIGAVEVGSLAIGALGFGYGIVKDLGEKRARNEVVELRERSQAERVSAWAGKRTDEGRRVYVRNTSEQIVRDVRAWLIAPVSPAPADDSTPDRPPVTRRAVLEPGAELEHLIPATSMRDRAPKVRPTVMVAFIDVDGREWIRTGDGRLIRMPTTHPGRSDRTAQLVRR